MKWIKVIVCGILATLAMDISMNALMYLFGLAPTNIHPAAAFLFNLGIESSTLSTTLHYSYGTLWALVFVYAFEDDLTVKRGLQLAMVLWLFMMLVYSPIIGWGFFGFGNAGLLKPSHPLYMNSTLSYLTVTFTVHVFYGLTLGIVSKTWIVKQRTDQKTD